MADIYNTSSVSIYDYGFDKNLTSNIRGLIILPKNPLVYNSITDVTQGQSIEFGAIVAGANNSVFIVDPRQGIWLGNTSFSSAPFRVNMNGDLTATSISLSGDLMEKVATFTTDVSITGTTETDIMNFSLPANNLGTTNALFGKIFIKDLDTAGNTLTIRLYYAATSISIAPAAVSNLANMSGYIEFFIMAAGATNSQELALSIYASEPIFDVASGMDVCSAGNTGTAAIDSTVAQTVKVTGQWSAGTHTFNSTMGIAYIVR